MNVENQIRTIYSYCGGGEAFQSHRNGDERVMPLTPSQEQENVKATDSQLESVHDLASCFAVQQARAVATQETAGYIQSQATLHYQEGEIPWLDRQQAGPSDWLGQPDRHGIRSALQPRAADDKDDEFKVLKANGAAAAVTAAMITTTTAQMSIRASKESFYGSTISSIATMDVQDKAKICTHPRYPGLVLAYTNCYKVGAPPDVVKRLDEIDGKYRNLMPLASDASIGHDPELDNFMDGYCDLLHKCHDELSKSFERAMSFIRNIELQLNVLGKGVGSCKGSEPEDKGGGCGTVTSDDEGSCCELHFNVESKIMMQQQQQEKQDEGGLGKGVIIEPLSEDRKIKEELMRRYRNCIGNLKQEFLKKKKKGKLPKEARDKLFSWWSQHYKWPYPSEAEKTALAETTGLDQKQINNWFINQRKRYWKPSEERQCFMVDPACCSQHPLCQKHVIPSNTAADSALQPFNAAVDHAGDVRHRHDLTCASTLSVSQQGGACVQPSDHA